MFALPRQRCCKHRLAGAIGAGRPAYAPSGQADDSLARRRGAADPHRSPVAKAGKGSTGGRDGVALSARHLLTVDTVQARSILRRVRGRFSAIPESIPCDARSKAGNAAIDQAGLPLHEEFRQPNSASGRSTPVHRRREAMDPAIAQRHGRPILTGARIADGPRIPNAR